MRLKLSRFRRNFNKDLPIEFTEQNLSSFGGLELFSRYLRRVELSRRVGKACRGKGIRSDYGSVRLVLVLVGMLLVGARRLEHLQYVCDDPMLLRFCGLRRLPSRPTIVNWLKQFTGERLKGLSELNGVLVHEQIERLGLNRLTVDMDGTVVQAGNQVGWAFRGFNPHRKKNKSYYPLFAHLAQTGQILKSRNRPGNVHDSKGADAFLRELIVALLHGSEQIADLPVPVAESPGAVRIGHPERGHLVEYLAPNSVFNSLPRQRSSPHLRPDDRLVTIDRVFHHASLGAA